MRLLLCRNYLEPDDEEYAAVYLRSRLGQIQTIVLNED
jgi:hypothetical protein